MRLLALEKTRFIAEIARGRKQAFAPEKTLKFH